MLCSKIEIEFKIIIFSLTRACLSSAHIMVVSVQSQIYLVAGILGGVSAILVVIVGVLFVVIDQLKNRLERVERAERTAVSTSRSATVTAASPRVIANVTGGHDNYAFTEPGIRPDEELARRGYVMSADQILAPRLQR